MGVEQRAGEGTIGQCDVAEALDVTIKLIGTPAEESGMGKVQPLRRGCPATW